MAGNGMLAGKDPLKADASDYLPENEEVRSDILD